MRAKLTILFICIGNSCRSPMAEAIARFLGGSMVDARSAGISPLGWVSEQTIDALQALGYPAEGLTSKGLDEVNFEDVDIVLSLLGDRGLDYLPRGTGARRVAWVITDPFGEDSPTPLVRMTRSTWRSRANSSVASGHSSPMSPTWNFFPPE